MRELLFKMKQMRYKLFFSFFISIVVVLVTSTILIYLPIEFDKYHNSHNNIETLSEFGYNWHDYMVDKNGIIIHSNNCHCLNDSINIDNK